MSQIRDPNYDDKVNITQPLDFNQTFSQTFADDCYPQNGLPFTVACNFGDTVGWAAYAGFAVCIKRMWMCACLYVRVCICVYTYIHCIISKMSVCVACNFGDTVGWAAYAGFAVCIIPMWMCTCVYVMVGWAAYAGCAVCIIRMWMCTFV